MTPARRCVAILHKMKIVENKEAEAALIDRLVETARPVTLGFVNAHGLNLSWYNPDIAAAFLSLDVLLRDGKGMELLSKRCKMDPGLNMNGTDLIPKLLTAGRSRRIALYGTRDPWLAEAANRLETKGANIAMTLDGFQDSAAYRQAARDNQPNIIVLAMGMPKQEHLAADIKSILPPTEGSLIICGGAILDFLAGRTARAPEWMQRVGIEWLFRLAQEPKRLWRRYIIGNMLFLWRIRQILKAVEAGT